MPELKGSRLVFSMIAIITVVVIALVVFMWRTAILIRDQTYYEYEFFKEDLYQKSALTNKSIMALFKLQHYEPGENSFAADKDKLDIYLRAIIGQQSIAEYINESLFMKLPENDPLLLHQQLVQLEPELKSISQHLQSFHKDLQQTSTSTELAELLAINSQKFGWSINRLNDYLNVQTKIQSIIFSQIQNSLLNTIKQLSLFFYVITALSLFNGLLIVFYFKDRQRARLALTASHASLETRVKERTAELEKSRRKLEDEVKERKYMEYQLRLKSDAIENALNGFDIVDEEGKFVYANKAYLDMWGYDSLDEIIGTSPSSHCKDPDLPQKVIAKLKENGEYVFEFVAKRKNGTFFDALMYARLAYDENGKEIYPTASVDISERKQAEINRRNLEKQLQHTLKMEAVGTLSGGVAHEFNNILAILIGNIELSMEDIKDPESLEEYLEEMKAASLRGKKVVQQLLNFSRKSSDAMTVLNIAKLTRDSLSLLRASLPAQIHIVEHIEGDCFRIKGEAGQIQQIIMNLCNNSAQAMSKDGGVIDISVSNQKLESSETFTDMVLSPGDYVSLTLKDNGPGIPQDILHRVFEPFFTTKDIDEGSGMGLSVVHGIVKSHNGGIRIISDPGRGVEVEICFPASDQMEEIKNSVKEIEISAISGSVLFVDDEEYITKLGDRILTRLGYHVVTHTDPRKALTEYRNHHTILMLW